MQQSFVLVAIVPAVALTVLMLWAIVSITVSIIRRQYISWLQVITIIVWLLALEAGVFLLMTVSAGLSHSSATIHRLPWLFGLSFVSIVVLPTAALIIGRRWLNRRNSNERKA
jgi:membrane protein implicated in regulation of membrane protease activity